MKKCCIILLILAAFTVLSNSLKSQSYLKPALTLKKNSLPENKSGTAITLPIGTVVVVFLYLVNPIIVYEDKKLYAGITKEFSVGWGKMGQHRTAFEYSFIFGGNIRNYFRLSYK